MNEPSERPTNSLYDYTDKSVPHAGYAAIVYGVVSLFTGLLALLQYFLYHQPGSGGFANREFVNQQWLQHTPLATAITVVFSVILAAISGVLAFGIFRRSRFAVVAMIVFVVVLQLYTWIVARSIAGSLVSIIVVAFLVRGARRMFQDHAERV
ncbi:MAG: hypothetical protein H0W66_04580 [Chthoniobacterales bacterium]|nr:hypothetical protein [Chthoniobacterales bacterium]